MPRADVDYTVEILTPSDSLGARAEIGLPTGAARPHIRVETGSLADAVDTTAAAMLDADEVAFLRGGALVRPTIEIVEASKERRTVAARFRDHCADSLAYRLSRVATFEGRDGRSGEWKVIDVPGKVLRSLLSQSADWSIPTVAGILTVPTLRPDGTLLTKAGYDERTRLYLVPDPGLVLPQIPDQPTRTEAEAALALLAELLDEFPFEREVDRAVALSAILTAVARASMSTAPVHGIRASTPGTGKSFLVDVISAVMMGRPCPVISAGKTEEETEKRLGAQILAAVPMVSIDNIEGDLGGVFLCQAAERPMLGIRPLGQSAIREAENRIFILLTGNNFALVGDMTRRAVLCQLDAGVERPELRNFRRDPVDLVLADRGLYVAAALTILRAYRVCSTKVTVPNLGSYGEWSRTVREPLVWLGLPDVVDTMEQAREGDPEQAAIRELFGQWETVLDLNRQVSANELVTRACALAPMGPGERDGFENPEFRDLLLRQAGEGSRVNTRRLAKWLNKIRGRVFDGRRLVVHPDPSNGNRYSLQLPERRG